MKNLRSIRSARMSSTGPETLELRLTHTVGNSVLVPITKAGDSPHSLSIIGTALYFTTRDAIHGQELWKSDATVGTAQLVRDIAFGRQGSYPSFLTEVSGTLFFSADDGIHGRELWKSDGTASGTSLVKDLMPGTRGVEPSRFTNVNGWLFFHAEGATGQELWKSDGTESGTLRVDNRHNGSSPNYLTNVNGTLFFQGYDRVHGVELWKSDGTPDGTLPVVDLTPGGDGLGPQHSYPQGLVNFQGRLYFTLRDEGGLWTSDGSEDGTYRLADVDVDVRTLTPVGETLYFAGNDHQSGWELWKSNGTVAGTQLVKDLWPGAESSYPRYLVNHQGILYFHIPQYSSGSTAPRGLWKSDGTDEGTEKVSTDESVYNLTSGEHGLVFSDGNSRLRFRSETPGESCLVSESLNSIHNVAFDRGSFFFVGRISSEYEIWRLSFTSRGPADINNDGRVDAADAERLFGAWGSSSRADLNQDGTVDASDAAILFEEWTG